MVPAIVAHATATSAVAAAIVERNAVVSELGVSLSSEVIATRALPSVIDEGTMNQDLNPLQKLEVIQDYLEKNQQKLFSFVKARLNSAVEADDLLQLGAIIAIEKSTQLKDPQRVSSWILTILKNVIFDFQRQNQRTKRTFSDLERDEYENLPNLDDSAPEKENICRCGAKLMNTIPPQYSTLLNRIDLDGEEISSIAKNLKTTPNNISVRLLRARNALKTAVQKHCQVSTLQQCLECDC